MGKQSGNGSQSKKRLRADSRVPPAAKAIPEVPEAPRQAPVDTKREKRKTHKQGKGK